MFVHTSAHSISGFPSTTKKLVIDLNYVPFWTVTQSAGTTALART
ncbi:hypothetical protein [Rubritalea tangerina]